MNNESRRKIAPELIRLSETQKLSKNTLEYKIVYVEELVNRKNEWVNLVTKSDITTYSFSQTTG